MPPTIQEIPPNDFGDYSSDDKPSDWVSCSPEIMAEEEGGKKKIRWQKGKPAASANTNTEEMDSTSDTSSKPGASSMTPAVIRERDTSSSSFLGKVIAFFFSPMGVATIFIFANLPWLKQYVGELSGISNATVFTMPTPVPLPAEQPIVSGTPSKKKSSPECQNPLKKLFHRNCRLEVRKHRREKKLEQAKAQRMKRQQRLKKRKAPPVVYANATLGTVKDTNTNDDTPFFHTLECSNILSRECRQKKRLMAQLAALAKENAMN